MQVISIAGVAIDGRGMEAVSRASQAMSDLPLGAEVTWVFCRIPILEETTTEEVVTTTGGAGAVGLQPLDLQATTMMTSSDAVLSPEDQAKEAELMALQDELQVRLEAAADEATAQKLRQMIDTIEAELRTLHPQTPRQKGAFP